MFERFKKAREAEAGPSLHDAARAGDCDAVAALLDGGADPNATDAEGRTPLHLVCAEGAPKPIADSAPSSKKPDRAKTLALLLDRGADPNAAEIADGPHRGFTPLHYAAAYLPQMKTPMIRALLERGADANRASADGQTCLERAALAGEDQLIRLLLSHGAAPDARLQAMLDQRKAWQEFVASADPAGDLRAPRAICPASEASLIATLLQPIQAAVAKAGSYATVNLTRGQRLLLAAHEMDAEARLSGFQGYFRSQAADCASDALAALERTGAARARDILLRATSVFGGGDYPKERIARWNAMDALRRSVLDSWKRLDAEYRKSAEPLPPLLLGLAREFPEEFFR